MDIAYRSDRDLTESEEVTINQKLSEICRMSEVDTVNLKTASPLLRRQILDSAQVLFDKTGLEFDQFELYALRSFAEAKPLFDLRREKINAFLDNYYQSRTN